ncbi:MAG TPA: hypothetical protein VIV65_02335 [Gemmatimonadaceae bacterium]|jgi:hypothetical protein
MTAREDQTDRTIAKALRQVEAVYRGSIDSLARRIDAASVPLLAARIGREPLAWWDYAAQWSSALIPASVLLAAASVAFLIVIQPPAKAASRPVVAATRPVTRSAVDRAVDDLFGEPARVAHRRR